MRGFTLIQLAVILTIVSVVLTGFLNIGSYQTKRHETAKTERKIGKVIEAVKESISGQVNLGAGGAGGTGIGIPCPAEPLPKNHANFGISNCNFDPYSVRDTYGILTGAVPVNTLKIPYDMAYDENGNLLEYVMTYALRTNTGLGGVGEGNITVMFPGSDIPAEDKAALVVFAHGENGTGAMVEGGDGERHPGIINDEAAIENFNCSGGISSNNIGGMLCGGGYNNIFIKQAPNKYLTKSTKFDQLLEYQTVCHLLTGRDWEGCFVGYADAGGSDGGGAGGAAGGASGCPAGEGYWGDPCMGNGTPTGEGYPDPPGAPPGYTCCQASFYCADPNTTSPTTPPDKCVADVGIPGECTYFDDVDTSCLTGGAPGGGAGGGGCVTHDDCTGEPGNVCCFSGTCMTCYGGPCQMDKDCYKSKNNLVCCAGTCAYQSCTCTPTCTDGTQCGSSTECVNNCCDSFTGTCVTPPPTGMCLP